MPKDELKAKIEKKFGTITDPKADSKFDLDGDTLKITMPANEDRRFGYTKDPKTGNQKFDHTPKVTFPQTADFTLVVRVVSPVDAKSQGIGGFKGGYSGGGVLVAPVKGEPYRFGVLRSSIPNSDGNIFPLESPGTWTQGFAGVSHKSLTGETTWLRVVRTGKALNCEASADGKEWVQLNVFLGAIPDETVSVARYAQHCSDTTHTVTFDQFSIEKPKAEKK